MKCSKLAIHQNKQLYRRTDTLKTKFIIVLALTSFADAADERSKRFCTESSTKDDGDFVGGIVNVDSSILDFAISDSDGADEGCLDFNDKYGTIFIEHSDFSAGTPNVGSTPK